MDSSPKGRTIEKVEGDAEEIVSRGHKIESLGDQMIDSASTLKKIADGATGQKGLAVSKLQDVVGDTYKELKLAGERYKPTGPAFIHYGTTLADVQPKIASAVSDCEDDWAIYAQKQGSIPPVGIPSGTEPSGEDDSAAKKAAKERKDAESAADSAYTTWKARAEEFDAYYDTWEDAFDKAVDEIGKADDGSIKDTFWDTVDAFVATALKILNVVGLVLAIACIVIGGPIFAALAAAVALVTLALTVYSYCRGNSSVTDLVFAAIAVVPFGRLGSLAKTGERANVFRGMIGMANKGETGIIGATKAFKPMSGAERAAAFFNPEGSKANIISRLFTGRSMSGIDDISAAVTKNESVGKNITNLMSGIWGDGFMKNIFGTTDMAAGVFGHGHNDVFPSSKLKHPVFGPQSVVVD